MSELFDLEILYKVNSASFGAAFKLSFPNAHHHEIIHLSNPFFKEIEV